VDPRKLDDLGWEGFEQLIQALLKATLGLGIEAWGGSGDLGRDAYYEGVLNYPTNTPQEGGFVFQCKFVNAANAPGANPDSRLRHAVKNEAAKISQNIEPSGKWKLAPCVYAFFTNAPVSQGIRTEIRNTLESIMPEVTVVIHDGRDVCAQLLLVPSLASHVDQMGRMSASFNDLVTLLRASSLIPPTAQKYLENAQIASESQKFQDAAIDSEAAVEQATKDDDLPTKATACLYAVRSWANHALGMRLSAEEQHIVKTRISKLIAEAEASQAVASEVALSRCFLAILDRDYLGLLNHSESVLADTASCDNDRGEALSFQLQALLHTEREHEGLALKATYMHTRERLAGEPLLLLEMSWLRVLIATDVATDEDFNHSVHLLAQLAELTPERRLYHIDLVVRTLRKYLQLSSNSSRLTQLQQMLEESYHILANGAATPRSAQLAGEIALIAAERGDESKSLQFLELCDSAIEKCKAAASPPMAGDWIALRAFGLQTKGRVYLRLSREITNRQNAPTTTLKAAQEALNAASKLARKNRAAMKGDTDTFLAINSYFSGEVSAALGDSQEAASHFQSCRSPAAMANSSFRSDLGAWSFVRQAEELCFAGDIKESENVIELVVSDSRMPERVVASGREFKGYLNDTIKPIMNWFEGPGAMRIDMLAKREGLRRAIASQTTFLADWYASVVDQAGVYQDVGNGIEENGESELMAKILDIWGRGGFSRVVAAIRARPKSAIAVDAYELEDVRVSARMLCPLFDTVIVKWKGPLEPDTGLRAFPDPNFENDADGEFFGGSGFVRCGGGPRWATVLLGCSNLIQASLAKLIACEALPLIRDGRLLILPAPLIGCTQSAVGWTDHLLTKGFMRGVPTVMRDQGCTSAEVRALQVATYNIPFINGVALSDLSKVLNDIDEFLIPLRQMMFQILHQMSKEQFHSIQKLEVDFRHACNKLDERLSSVIRNHRDLGWRVEESSAAANAIQMRGAATGRDMNTDLLKAVSPENSNLDEWIPFWQLRNLGGYLDWGHSLDNRVRPVTPTQFGTIRHSWLYPGNGGPGLIAGWAPEFKPSTDPKSDN
jgi:hypothetical protein